DLTSHGPQRLFGIARKGRIAAGYDADFTIVDLKRGETIRNAQAGSRAGWTAYDRLQVTGRPAGTVVRGRAVMVGGQLGAAGPGGEGEGGVGGGGQGEAVLFGEAVPAAG